MKNLALFLLLSLAPLLSLAQNQPDLSKLPPKVTKLLSQETRPTLKQAKKVIGTFNFPKGIPVDSNWSPQTNSQGGADVANWTKIAIDYAPELIAKMEKTYPHATWVFLGRDGVVFADILEAFYSLIGDSNRVLRLGVSKGSMNSLTQEAVIDLLKEQDFDLTKFQSKKSAPLILVDTVSGGNGRQGRQVLALIYEYLMFYKSEKFEDLIKSVNMLGLVVSTHPGGHIPAEDRKQYEKDVLSNVTNLYGDVTQRSGFFNNFFNNHTFVSIDQAPNYANEAGYTHYIGAWHESYDAFYKDKDGKLRAKIGVQSEDAMKLSVLWTQSQVLSAVYKSSFLKSVEAEAKALGVQFSSRTSCSKILKSGVPSLEELRKKYAGFEGS